MKDSFPQRLDSESIRQGLLSIRNSQIELLNQLKIETQQLKKAPSRYGLSVQPIKFEERLTNNDDFAVSSSNTSQIPLQQKNSPSAAFLYQKHCSLVVADERNETVQKLLYPKSSDKQRVRQLQNYLYLSQKIATQLISQLIAGTPLSQIKRNWQSDLQLNKDIYSKYQQSHHQLVLQMLRERESVGVLNRPNSSESAKERDLAVQLRELKEQLSIIVNNSQQKGQRTSIDVENSRLREQEELLTRRCEEMQKEIHKFDRENRELALCWERESSQRKSLLNQLQKMRKKIAASEQKEKAAALLQKDLQQRLANPQKLLKDKQTTDPVPLQNAKKLTQAVGMLREQNDKLRREIKAINETKSNAERQQLQAMKQVQSQLISKQAQQTAMLRNYQQQIHDLRSHLCEVKKNQEMMMQAQSKQKENEMANQELIWRKVYAIKTNSTVQHLWQIKNAEYENVGRVLYELRRH